MKTEIQSKLTEFANRVNVMTRHCSNDRLVLLYDDHRYLLNILFKIFKSGELKSPPNLVFFDSHDDAGHAEKKSKLLDCIGVADLAEATEKQFAVFVDYDIRTDDGNWLSVACELNLVGDVVLIGNKHSTNVASMKGLYKSEDGKKHKVFQMKTDLSYELGERGQLGDLSRDEDFKAIRKFFAYSPSRNYGHVGEMKPYVLDFDLDYFTLYSEEEGTMPWPRFVWKKHFEEYSLAHNFVWDLMSNSIVTTVCREPDYCRNIGGANYNLENLDAFFFGGQLGTNLGFE